ncbi:MAG: hypothetical protein AAGG48_08000 [Planctomycetota bacterium]
MSIHIARWYSPTAKKLFDIFSTAAFTLIFIAENMSCGRATGLGISFAMGIAMVVTKTSRVRFSAVGTRILPVLTAFSGSDVASVQAATDESLLAEANTLPIETSAVSYVIEDSRNFHQASGIFVGTKFQTIIGRLGDAWADNHSPASLEEDDLDWVLRMMMPIQFKVRKDRAIDRLWAADLLPSESGEYTFSLRGLMPSPRFVAGQQLPGDSGRWDQEVAITVDGQVVLEATSQEWTAEATPISLPTSIEVSLQYSAVSAVAESAAVQLFWSGPGIEKQLIVPSFYRLEETSVDSAAYGSSVELIG